MRLSIFFFPISKRKCSVEVMHRKWVCHSFNNVTTYFYKVLYRYSLAYTLMAFWLVLKHKMLTNLLTEHSINCIYIFEQCSRRRHTWTFFRYLFMIIPIKSEIQHCWPYVKYVEWEIEREIERKEHTHKNERPLTIYQLNLPQLSISASLLLHKCPKCYGMEKRDWCKQLQES